ncbi:NnrU family protein [Jiella sp. M17.18]|uniref:NnrU family protein n=1 Tax=Jiella sp. M17.18 TaxID=3234247 RepID=UPI0034DDE490
MDILVAGLIVFLGLHSLRIFFEGGRATALARLGEARFKGAYSVLSLIGLVLLVYGYGVARDNAVALYDPPTGLRHLTLALVPIAFILVASAYGPIGHIKAAVRHPMVLGVALWAFGHLLSNGTSADVVLFGASFVWALLDYASSLRRTAREGTEPVAKGVRGDIGAVVIGLVLAGIFVGGLHRWLFGVSPLP